MRAREEIEPIEFLSGIGVSPEIDRSFWHNVGEDLSDRGLVRKQ